MSDTDFTKRKRLNWNTVGICLVIFIAAESYREMRMIHDAVIGQNYQLLDLKTRVTALELDWQKWKDKHP